jgi:hypothetical protein
MTRRVLIGITAAAALAAAAPAAAAVPKVGQLVAFRDGSAIQTQASAAATTVKAGRATCAVGSGTPLAALARTKPPGLKVRDFGSCSRRTADAGGLFVYVIGKDRNRGQNGWVYKVGNKVATAGAGDPSGPFGRGRLKNGQRVTWFYCRMNTRTQSCQRTLVVTPQAQGGGVVRATVRAYDDRGRAKPAAGVTVHAGSATATAGSDGVATLNLPPGQARVYADGGGMVRSFEEAVDVT